MLPMVLIKNNEIKQFKGSLTVVDRLLQSGSRGNWTWRTKEESVHEQLGHSCLPTGFRDGILPSHEQEGRK